jgi:hypothetical protein
MASDQREVRCRSCHRLNRLPPDRAAVRCGYCHEQLSWPGDGLRDHIPPRTTWATNMAAQKAPPQQPEPDLTRRPQEPSRQDPAPPRRQQAPDPRRAWDAEVNMRLRSMEQPRERWDVLLGYLWDGQFGWFGAAETWPSPGVRASESWLDEIIARADSLAGHMKKAPMWPAIFESQDLTVVIAEQTGTVLGWVGVGRRGTLVAFRPSTWELLGGDGSPVWRAAVGFAVSWFVDVSIRVPEGARAPYERSETKERSAGGQASVRYVPRPSFSAHATEVANRRRQSPPAHRVSGHVRRLRDGQTPSPAARNQAPAHIRRHLAQNETFVREHKRGDAKRTRALLTYLSRYSMLADSLGLARLA